MVKVRVSPSVRARGKHLRLKCKRVSRARVGDTLEVGACAEEAWQGKGLGLGEGSTRARKKPGCTGTHGGSKRCGR